MIIIDVKTPTLVNSRRRKYLSKNWTWFSPRNLHQFFSHRCFWQKGQSYSWGQNHRNTNNYAAPKNSWRKTWSDDIVRYGMQLSLLNGENVQIKLFRNFSSKETVETYISMVKIRLPPQCQINYVSIQGNYLKMRYINVANNVTYHITMSTFEVIILTWNLSWVARLST